MRKWLTRLKLAFGYKSKVAKLPEFKELTVDELLCTLPELKHKFLANGYAELADLAANGQLPEEFIQANAEGPYAESDWVTQWAAESTTDQLNELLQKYYSQELLDRQNPTKP